MTTAVARDSGARALYLFLLLTALAVASRLLWHPPNFTAIDAIAIFAGARLLDRKLAFLLPLTAMAISDLALQLSTGMGLHSGMWVVYLAIACTTGLGMLARGRGQWALAGAGVAGATLFFALTNLAVWATSGMYTLDFAGLSQCFAMAIPFYQWQLAGVLFYGAVLLGTEALVTRRFTALAPAH